MEEENKVEETAVEVVEAPEAPELIRCDCDKHDVVSEQSIRRVNVSNDRGSRVWIVNVDDSACAAAVDLKIQEFHGLKE